MSQQLIEIRRVLNAKANKNNSEVFLKMVPGRQKIYGVKTPDLNLLVQQYKTVSFDLARELWESVALEEKIIAIKIMEKTEKSDQKKWFSLFKKFWTEVENWAVGND